MQCNSMFVFTLHCFVDIYWFVQPIKKLSSCLQENSLTTKITTYKVDNNNYNAYLIVQSNSLIHSTLNCELLHLLFKDKYYVPIK